MLATTPPGNNVIQGEILGLLGAILARILVTTEHLEATQPALMAGTGNHIH